MYEGKQGKEGERARAGERLDWCCGADLNRYLAGRRVRPIHGLVIVGEGCVILLRAAQPLPMISEPQVTLLLFR